jgi:hypothetical protein
MNIVFSLKKSSFFAIIDGFGKRKHTLSYKFFFNYFLSDCFLIGEKIKIFNQIFKDNKEE